MALPTPALDQIKLKTRDQFRYIGKGTIKPVDQHDIITGKRDLWHRCAASGNEICRGRSPAGLRRQARAHTTPARP